jgi:hypothetical protein
MITFKTTIIIFYMNKIKLPIILSPHKIIVSKSDIATVPVLIIVLKCKRTLKKKSSTTL